MMMTIMTIDDDDDEEQISFIQGLVGYVTIPVYKKE